MPRYPQGPGSRSGPYDRPIQQQGHWQQGNQHQHHQHPHHQPQPQPQHEHQRHQQHQQHQQLQQLQHQHQHPQHQQYQPYQQHQHEYQQQQQSAAQTNLLEILARRARIFHADGEMLARLMSDQQPGPSTSSISAPTPQRSPSPAPAQRVRRQRGSRGKKRSRRRPPGSPSRQQAIPGPAPFPPSSSSARIVLLGHDGELQPLHHKDQVYKTGEAEWTIDVGPGLTNTDVSRVMDQYRNIRQDRTSRIPGFHKRIFKLHIDSARKNLVEEKLTIIRREIAAALSDAGQGEGSPEVAENLLSRIGDIKSEAGPSGIGGSVHRLIGAAPEEGSSRVKEEPV